MFVLGGSIAAGTFQFMDLLSTQRSSGLNLPMHHVYLGVLLGALYVMFIAVRRILASFGSDMSAPSDNGT